MFDRKLKDSSGRTVEVVDPGILNTNAGPDFFNSKVKLDGTEWVGNIEIHVKASDWYRHGHQDDPAYDNVILHVVGVSDKKVVRRDGTVIPQVELTMPEDFFRKFSTLNGDLDAVRCAASLPSIPSLNVNDWLETLAIERIQSKARKVKDIYDASGCDWEQTTFTLLARALGFGLNSEPFEMLGRSLPLKILHHHSDNPLQLQALLFGQAAMLDSSLYIFDEYYQLLCREYYFLARKYGLRPMRPGLWKYAKTRPQNFPHRRIAFLAKACEGGFSLFSKLISVLPNEDQARELFNWRLDGYWHDHFSFDYEARSAADSLSRNSVTLLLINVLVPLVYTCSALRGDPDLGEKAVNFLASLPAESNAIIRGWQYYGLKAEDASRTQALIHLRKEYCDNRKCLYCRFGHLILRQAVNQQSDI